MAINHSDGFVICTSIPCKFTSIEWCNKFSIQGFEFTTFLFNEINEVRTVLPGQREYERTHWRSVLRWSKEEISGGRSLRVGVEDVNCLPHTQTCHDRSLLTVTVLPMHGSDVDIVWSIVKSLMVPSDTIVCQTGSHMAETCSLKRANVVFGWCLWYLM
jgi:hypothetical protein